ncbi:hypothetical protein FOA52_012086 [Chlamydomonas sp. UWO 241]|nr:hypothetical protein FOA52_012086 [Chlamydomonas sp. UWO 241]
MLLARGAQVAAGRQAARMLLPQQHAVRRLAVRAGAGGAPDARHVPWLVSLDAAPPLPHALRPAASGRAAAAIAAALSSPPTDADAILMLAGGQTNTGNNLPPWVERRLDTCLGLQRLQSKPCPVLCLGGGTPHKPPILRPSGHVIHESTSCAEYLIAGGAPRELILKETSSYDTVGNAFFSLAIHALPAGWRRVLVVTSDFHMPRSAVLFQDMYSLAGADLLGDPERFQLTFAACSDEGLFEGEVLAARQEKEAGSLVTWRKNASGFKRFSDLHEWLHQTHQCYAVSRQHDFDKATIQDPRLLASY